VLCKLYNTKVKGIMEIAKKQAQNVSEEFGCEM
jgi:hypothetical protein